ncbi:hypothetical protein BU23DRAFT_571695 [Bimuria novae-zelandiae CBS 107.79]|uniref:Uncharacterized protein n=1 Tax=Bimuria novae-zelandiae CBS 107.79 TaxID=1447943 RepID=A0A6A5UX54_9PLEO|nr:hypothetical protein BU23DRAFT_571695 [Bimuria novae-zelandiae CBS 107.79]
MARLSIENTPAHIDAISTPKQKSERKSSRFKDFFKGGHSRSNLSAGSSSGSPAGSPPTSSQKGGMDLRPGFAKVGLHPSERSRALDLDEWEKVKEDNQQLGHAAKIELCKEQEDKKHRETIGSEQHAWNSPSLDVRERMDGEKAMKILGVDGDATTEHQTTATTVESTTDVVGDSHQKTLSDWERNRREKDVEDAKAESLRKACKDSTSSSTDIDRAMQGVLDRAAPFASEPDRPYNANASPASGTHPALHHSPPLVNLRSSVQDHIISDDDSVSNIENLHEDDSVLTNPSVSLEQQIADAIGQHEFRFHRSGLADVGDTGPGHVISAADRIRSKIFTDLGTSPRTPGAVLPAQTAVYKIGPLVLDSNTATALITMHAVLGSAVLFIKAMEGPWQFIVASWRLSVFLFTYKCLRKFLGWQHHGSRDVLLVPVEELGVRVMHCSTEMVATLSGTLGHAISVALMEIDLDDDA